MAKQTTSKLKGRDPEQTNPGKAKMLIFGPAGVGKSWLSLDFARPFYYDTEGGARLRHYQAKLKAVGGSYMGPQDGTLEFSVLFEQLEALATEVHPFKTFVLDSVTKIFQNEIAAEAARLQAANRKDEFGASKKPAVANMRRLASWLTRLDMNVIVVAHQTALYGMDGTQRTEIGVKEDSWEKLEYELDLKIRAMKQGNSRYALVAKTRLQGFPDGERFPLDYQEFKTRYAIDYGDDDRTDVEAVPIVLATQDQTEELKRLIALLHITEETVGKWLNKGNATELREFTTEQAAKLISGMTAKIKP